MIKIIKPILVIVSFMIESSAWIYVSSNMSFYLKRLLKPASLRTNLFLYSLLYGFIIEIILSVISMIFVVIIPWPDSDKLSVAARGLETGIYYAVMLSPVTSTAGSFLGITSYKPPWKRI